MWGAESTGRLMACYFILQITLFMYMLVPIHYYKNTIAYYKIYTPISHYKNTSIHKIYI